MDHAAAATAAAPAVSRAAVFVRERFPPGTYGPLIVAFAACGSIAAAAATDRPVSLGAAGIAATVVALAFLRMRLLDEVKDFAIDRLGRPGRPLPRGLVTASELRVAAWLALGAMTLSAALLGVTAFAVYLAAAAFLVASGVDFGAGSVLHARRFVYALVHSPAVPMLLLVTWFAQPGAIVDDRLGWLLVIAWSTGLGAEIGRKTVGPKEERPFVETYSQLVGQGRALFVATVALATGAIATAGYAAASHLPPIALTVSLAGAVAILASWPLLRHSRGGTIELWSGAVALLILLGPPLLGLLVP